MKKLMMIAAFMVACVAANAQFYVGGSFGFESAKADKDADNTTAWSIVPEIGYNIDDKLAVGLQIGYGQMDIEGDLTGSELILAPYARYTFAESGIVKFFVDGGLTYTSYGSDLEGNTWGIGIRPGINIAASEKVGLVAKLGYIGYSKNSDELGGGSSFGLGVDNTDISFGVYFNF